jgi:nucleoside-diphosphate-sugar epimerase
MESQMKILITGGAGYIGSAICRQLEKLNDINVEILDRFDDGSKYVNSFINNENFSFTKSDIRDLSILKKSIDTADVIIHLAAIVGFPACDANPYEAQSINIQGTKDLCKLISVNQLLIFASTGSAYGKIDGICTEETPINPISLYGRSKAIGEEFVSKVDGISLRLATLYGTSYKVRDDLLIHTLAKDAVKNGCLTVFQGSAMRTFLDVNHAASVFVSAAFDKLDRSNIYNVGDERLNFTKNDVAKIIADYTNVPIFSDNYKQDPDARDYNVSYEKIKRKGLNFEADFKKDVISIINYYRLN